MFKVIIKRMSVSRHNIKYRISANVLLCATTKMTVIIKYENYFIDNNVRLLLVQENIITDQINR